MKWNAEIEYQSAQRRMRTGRMNIRDEQGHFICKVETAEASLISAAPEMLQALKKIESCLAPEDNDIAARLVRAAIAKTQVIR